MTDLSDTSLVLYTIGHSNHSLAAFLELLRRHQIETVADVRSSPYSRHFPQFNKEALANALSQAGMRYLFLGHQLGGRPRHAARDRNGGVDLSCLAKAPAFQQGIDLLLSELKQSRVAIMCAEKDPLCCHRGILICRHLRRYDLRIRHILADGALEEHPQAEQRLLKLAGFEPDLFCPQPEEFLEQAYDHQAHKNAHTPDKAAILANHSQQTMAVAHLPQGANVL